MQSVRIIEIPKCKMVSSGTGLFGQDKFERFIDWFTNLPKTVYPKDFLLWDGAGFCWLYLYDEHLAGRFCPRCIIEKRYAIKFD